MKLLYLSSWHGTMEYDELSLFTEMGIDWFSTGYYANPREPMDTPFRYGKPPIDKDVDEKILDMFNACNPHRVPHGDVRFNMWLLMQFDAVLVSNCAPNSNILFSNLPLFKAANLPVIWRTYGQQQEYVEQEVKRNQSKYPVILVRGSPKESLIPHYAGEDYIIRPHVDNTKFNGWHGSRDYILSFNNFYNQRQWVSNTKEYEYIINNLPAKLYGDKSEGAPNYGGLLTVEEQLEKYRECKVYFALGSKPAFMTYNMIEAMMVGCPVITWNKGLGGAGFEGPDLFEDGKDCIMMDDVSQIRNILIYSAGKFPINGREAAIKHYGKERCRRQWEQVFKEVIK